MGDYRLPTASLDLTTLMDVKKKELAIDLKVAKLGIIDSYNSSTGTANVKIQTKFNEKTSKVWDYQIIPNVPVVKSKYFSHPIKKGDGCLIIFLDTDFTAWLESGDVIPPATPRLHNLNDAIAIMGVDTKSERPSFGNDNVEINADSGKIDVKNNTTDLYSIFKDILDALNLVGSAIQGLSGVNPIQAQITSLTSSIPALLQNNTPTP